MSTETVVRARIDPQIKRDAHLILSGLGLSMSDAIRMLLHRIAAERALPFEVRLPNTATRQALEEAEGDDLAEFDTVEALMADLSCEEEVG